MKEVVIRSCLLDTLRSVELRFENPLKFLLLARVAPRGMKSKPVYA